MVLVSDMNDWSPGYGQTFAPHAKNGPLLEGLDASNPNSSGATPAEVGATGGNVGLLDGSVSWKSIKKMEIYRGSQQWEKWAVTRSGRRPRLLFRSAAVSAAACSILSGS